MPLTLRAPAVPGWQDGLPPSRGSPPFLTPNYPGVATMGTCLCSWRLSSSRRYWLRERRGITFLSSLLALPAKRRVAIKLLQSPTDWFNISLVRLPLSLPPDYTTADACIERGEKKELLLKHLLRIGLVQNYPFKARWISISAIQKKELLMGTRAPSRLILQIWITPLGCAPPPSTSPSPHLPDMKWNEFSPSSPLYTLSTQTSSRTRPRFQFRARFN